MANIKAAFNEAPEEQLAPEANYDLRIVNKEWGTSKSGRQMLTVLIRAEGGNYAPFYHWLVFPSQEDWQEDSEKAKRMLRGIRRFLAVFNIKETADGFDDDDIDGATGRCILTVERDDTGNEHNRLRLPRLRE